LKSDEEQRKMSKIVLDSSAMLAFVNEEPGTEVVAQFLSQAVMSAVNLSEVVAKLADRDVPESVIQKLIAQMRVRILPIDQAQAVTAGLLRSQTGVAE
jgi:PIN domain nuclease of toxin-antitoxin system